MENKISKFDRRENADARQKTSSKQGGKEAPLIEVLMNRDIYDSTTMELVRELLENGAAVNGRSLQDRTPLMIAASKRGSMSMLQMLLDHGANILDQDDNGNTALMYALCGFCGGIDNIIPVIHFLKRSKGSFSLSLREALSTMMRVQERLSTMMRVMAQRYSRVAPVLSDQAASFSDDDNTALIPDLVQNCPNALFLLQFTKDKKDLLNVQNHQGLTALMCAVACGSLGVTVELIDQGADVKISDVDGYTALLHALIAPSSPDKRILTALINAGSDVNRQTYNGFSPLMIAARKCTKDIILLLLNSGADVNAARKTYAAETALSFISKNPFLEKNMTRTLASFLDRGASSSHLKPAVIHRLILRHQTYIIPKLIGCGLGPADVRSDQVLKKVVITYKIFPISPLCMALLANNIALARYFKDNLYLTNSDVSSLKRNKFLRNRFQRCNQFDCLDFLDQIFTQPIPLFKLAFLAVSSAIGTSHGREKRVDKLPVPQMVKDKLLFKVQSALYE